MPRVRKRRDDEDFGDLEICKKPSSSNNTAIYVILTCAIIGVVLLLSCVGGMVFLIVLLPVSQGPEAAKLNGVWKGRVILRGTERDDVYTFHKNGTLRENVFDLRGNFHHGSDGLWRFRDGKVEIDWLGGGLEFATVRWIDDNTMEYHIVDHTDAIQIGTKITFRRQK